MKLGYLFLVLFAAQCTRAWDSSDFEIFDLVEEISENFYLVLNVSQDATTAEIKKAFRALSILVHPDKSTAEDANIRFRNLVSVYEVLRDTEKREKYDLVLKNGLPSWKSGLWYYRKIRKMGLWESSFIVFAIVCVGQYLIAWGAYLEKKHTAEAVLGTKIKRMQKKTKTNVDLANIINEIPTPSVFNTLPFQIPMFFWNCPGKIKGAYTMYKEIKLREKLDREEEQEEERRLQEEEAEYQKYKEESKALKKRKIFVAPEKTDEELAGYSSLAMKEDLSEGIRAVNSSKGPISGGFWTDDDLTELIRLVKKYPGGMSSRWDTIAETMNRSVPEVTFMAAKLKENNFRLLNRPETQSDEVPKPDEIRQKVKTKKDDATNLISVPESNWTQEQQRALETAIGKFGKGCAERWQKIANCVPDKDKEECMLRYKYLVEMVKKQKQKSEPEEEKQVEEPQSEAVVLEPKSQAEAEAYEDQSTIDTSKGKGKPRNKRKERKKQMDCLDDSEEDE